MLDGNENDRTMLVTGHARIADDVWHITLRDPDGAELPAWEAGAHIDIVLDADPESQEAFAIIADSRWQMPPVLICTAGMS